VKAIDWFRKASEEKFAIGAFNVDNLDIFHAVCQAGKNRKSPVMLEFSEGEAGYFGLENIADLVANARDEYKIPILLNLDHAKNVETCLKAIEIAGFDDVHFDGSELSFEDNIKNTKKVVEAAHKKELLVEGEFDKVSGSSAVHTDEVDLEDLKSSYTNPIKAAEFVAKTNVDILATVFGNIHGTFPIQPDLDFKLLDEIRTILPDTFLSMHGGSGISAQQVKEAIKVGKIVKINVNTELRQAFKDALTEELGENPKEYAYYKLTPDIVTAVASVVEAKINVFGSGGKA
jgi:fructose-bisphosphate aldolase, class II